jgi:hypothetical protein
MIGPLSRTRRRKRFETLRREPRAPGLRPVRGSGVAAVIDEGPEGRVGHLVLVDPVPVGQSDRMLRALAAEFLHHPRGRLERLQLF